MQTPLLSLKGSQDFATGDFSKVFCWGKGLLHASFATLNRKFILANQYRDEYESYPVVQSIREKPKVY
jgi:hypothetical protein